MYLLHRLRVLRLFPLCLVECSSLSFCSLSTPLIVHVPIIEHIPIGSLHCFGFPHQDKQSRTPLLLLSKHRTRTQSTILNLSHPTTPSPTRPLHSSPQATDSPCTIRDSPTARAYPRYRSTKYRSPEHQQNRPTHPTASHAPTTQPTQADRTPLTNRAIPFSSLPPNDTNPNPNPIRIQCQTDDDEESPGAAWQSSQKRDHPGGKLGQHHASPERHLIQRDHFSVSKPGRHSLPNRPAATTDPFPINRRVDP